jgi:hypothetical protein
MIEAACNFKLKQPPSEMDIRKGILDLQFAKVMKNVADRNVCDLFPIWATNGPKRPDSDEFSAEKSR